MLQYLDDFLLVCRSQAEVLAAGQFAIGLCSRLGIAINFPKSDFVPTQRREHLGVVVNTKLGMFELSVGRLSKLRASAAALLATVCGSRRWVPKRRLAEFAGLAQSCSLAVPGTRFHLMAVYDSISSESGWSAGVRVRVSKECVHDLRWWLQLPRA